MRQRFWQFAIGLICIVSIGLLVNSAVRANPAPTLTPDVDDGILEVGVEWDTDNGTRPYWYDSANGVYDWLVAAGWQGNFTWANSLAWEEDFKAAANGGTEDIWIDSVDLALIGTHGSGAYDSFWGTDLSSVWFSTSHDDQHLSPGEAYLAYGDGDLEWLAFDSCSVLNDGSIGYWASTFNGLHLLFGFENTMYVGSPGDGYYWGFLMTPKPWCPFCPTLTTTQAWFAGTDWNQPAGVRARVLAEELDNYNDYIWGAGYVSPDYPPDSDFWWWDHVSGTPDPLPLSGPITSLPIVEVIPRTVDESYVQGIGYSFGLTSTVYADPDGGDFYLMTSNIGAEFGNDNVLVMVAADSGSFYYLDLDTLWKEPAQQLPASDDEARQLALNYLAAHDSLPGVFGFDDTIAPTVTLEGQSQGITGQIPPPGTPISNATNLAISYARTVQLDTGPRLSIVGPGSRQNLYFGGNNEVVGLKGGWRDVQIVSGSSISVTTSDAAWAQFLADRQIAVVDVPMADLYELQAAPAPTLAYYEQPSTIGQSQLIPVWVFVADLYVDTGLSGQSLSPAGQSLLADDAMIYVPASAEPEALPQATIISPTVGTVITPGQTVDLSGTVVGGFYPLTYEWSSNVDGFLGYGPTLDDVLLTVDNRTGLPAPNIVTLRVTDANGMTAEATVAITILGPTAYLPAILKE